MEQILNNLLSHIGSIWFELLPMLHTHNVTVEWVKVHANNKGNIRADELSKLATKGELSVDLYYEEYIKN